MANSRPRKKTEDLLRDNRSRWIVLVLKTMPFAVRRKNFLFSAKPQAAGRNRQHVEDNAFQLANIT